MSITRCPTCGETHSWKWEEAFDKFGFGDGDSLVMTEYVAATLRGAGYAVVVAPWGVHNVVIEQIGRDGMDLIPDTVNVGYDDPRDYLPKSIVELLNAAFPEQGEVAL